MGRIMMFMAGALLSGLLGAGESTGATVSAKTQTSSGGGVTVKATLLESKTNDDLRFHVVLDTHSVNLDGYDLKRLTVLRDGAANFYHPTSVETKGSGHHREATVVFNRPNNSVKKVELLVRGIAGIHERVFQWDLGSR